MAKKDQREAARPSVAIGWAALGLSAVALAASIVVYRKASDLETKVNARLGETDQRVAGLVQKVDQASKSRAPQQGPDPAKVYPIKTDGAPSRGPAGAVVTIAEFSDYQ